LRQSRREFSVKNYLIIYEELCFTGVNTSTVGAIAEKLATAIKRNKLDPDEGALSFGIQ
jgi:hypothetical protein